MYIGACQEFKLARLIQQQQPQDDPRSKPARKPLVSVPGQRRAPVPKKKSGGFDDSASVASSTRSEWSGYSTQSAPPKLPSSNACLNEFCDRAGHSGRKAESVDGSAPRARSSCSARPRSSTGSRGAAHSSLPPRAGRPAAKSTPKAGGRNKGPSLEEQRRARILHMQKLYGLGGDPELEEKAPEPSTEVGVDRPLPDTGMNSIPAGADMVKASYSRRDVRGTSINDWPLTSLPEDPIEMSMSMGSSGGLIAWSKNLQPDTVSPSATLAGLFGAPA